MGQVDSSLKQNAELYNSVVGKQIYGLTKEYVDSCHTLTEDTN